MRVLFQSHQARADCIVLPCCLQPTDFAQFLLTAWRVRGNVCQRFILDDSSAGEVLVLCFPFAPCGKGFQAAKHIGLATGDADAMPAFLRNVGIVRGLTAALHFLVAPASWPGPAELLPQQGEKSTGRRVVFRSS